jgi:hypothetical protein
MQIVQLTPIIPATQKDQEDRGSKPAWANSSQDLILKRSFTKRAGVGPEIKSQYHKQNKERKKKGRKERREGGGRKEGNGKKKRKNERKGRKKQMCDFSANSTSIYF